MTSTDQLWEGLNGISLGSVHFFFSSHQSAGVDEIYSTVLSSAGNDGRVRLWKATAGNVWRSAGSVGVEQTDASSTKEKDVEMEQ